MGNDFQSRILHPSVKIKIFSDVQGLKQFDSNDQFLYITGRCSPWNQGTKSRIEIQETWDPDKRVLWNFHIDDDEGVALDHIVAKPISKKPNWGDGRLPDALSQKINK